MNITIKGIGLLFPSLYFVGHRTAPQANLGKRMTVARNCQHFSCRNINSYSKPVRLFQDKPVKRSLIASFLSCTAGCRFLLNLEILSFLFFIEGMYINPTLAKANSHPSKCNTFFPASVLSAVLSAVFSLMTLFNH